jgi:hypothetical protein
LSFFDIHLLLRFERRRTHTDVFTFYVGRSIFFTFCLNGEKSENKWFATGQKDWYSNSVHRTKTSAHPVSHPTVEMDQFSSFRRSGPLDWKIQTGPVLKPFMTWTKEFWTKNRHGTWRLIIGGVLGSEFHWFPTVLKVGRQIFLKKFSFENQNKLQESNYINK